MEKYNFLSFFFFFFFNYKEFLYFIYFSVMFNFLYWKFSMGLGIEIIATMFTEKKTQPSFYINFVEIHI